MRNHNSRVNVLLITIDTLRTDRVSYYSSKHLNTPNLDGLAQKSIVFTRAFAHSSTTLPSHANILLGTTPSYHGVHDNANFVVKREFLTLAEYLKNYGYTTGAFVGEFPLESRFGLDQGFDIYDDKFNRGETIPGGGGERRAEVVLDSALSWLKNQASPWLLWIHCWDPHSPYEPPEPFKTQHARNLYDGEVAYVDSTMGILFRYLEEHRLFERTLVVFTGDHGESLGEHGEKTHGFLAYNTTIWIPLFIHVPGLSHRVVVQNVSHIDVFPTVCDILDIKKPGFLQGTSLLPAMKGRKFGQKTIYFESLSPYYNMGWAPIRGYVHHNEKFIDSPTPEAYNLEIDFEESKNLFSLRALANNKKKLNEVIRRERSEKAEKAGQTADRETLEKLKSLGYLAGLQALRKDTFSPEDDVKVLLPYHNRAMEALDLYRSGKPSEGIKALKDVIAAKKNISVAYLNLAFIYWKQKLLSDATAVLKMGLEALPDNYDIFSQYLAYLYEAGQFDEVIRIFETMQPPQVEFDPVVWNYVGLAYWKKGDDSKAQEYYEKSLAIDKEFAVPYANLGNLHFFNFKKTSDPAAYRSAVESYKKAVALDSAYGAAFHGLGVTYFQAGDYDAAVASLEKALELEPDFDEILFFLGLTYLRKGDITKGCSYLVKYKRTAAYDLLSPAEKARLEEIMAKCSR